MLSKPLVVLTLATLSLARLTKRTGASHWWSGLESYEVYHTRYMELSCNTQHNTTFFDSCCHPRLKNADISKVPEECLGSADCDDEDEDNTSAPAAPSSTSAPMNVAPVPTPPVEPTPDPAPTHTSSTHKAKPTSNPGDGSGSGDNSGSGNVQTGSGKGTFYTQNGNAGACGKFNPDSAKIVALDSQLYGDTGRTSPLCGKTIHITNTDNGKSVTAIVADACPTCVSKGSVDMSVGAFTEIATEEQGEVNIKWTIEL